MEHVVQFGINLDDESIKEAVVHGATKKLIKDLEDNVFSYKNSYSSTLSGGAQAVIEGWLEKNRDDIINKTVDGLIEILKNRKAFRDKIAEIDAGDVNV